MHLTDYEKEIVISILKGEVIDMDSFIRKYCNYYTGEVNAEFQGNKVNAIIGNNILLKDESEKDKIFVFKALVSKLEYEYLIDKIETDRYRLPGLMKFYPSKPFIHDDSQLLGALNEFRYAELHFSKDLNNFVENGFRTVEEIEKDLEKEDRERTFKLAIASQQTTKKVAYISLAISAVLTIISLLFNYITYKTTRQVEITNKDTSKVYMVNPIIKTDTVYKYLKDTIKVR